VPWYVRKPFGGHGPVRVNLSKTGLGVSMGVKGLRVGTGGRGQYVHGGRHGLYYRRQVGSKKTGRFTGDERGTSSADADQRSSEWARSHRTEDILSVVVPETEALVEAVNARSKRLPLWPFTAALFLILSVPTLGIAAPFGVLATIATYLFVDKRRRTTRVSYQLDHHTGQRAKDLYEAIMGLKGSHIKRQLLHSRAAADPKSVAGAGQVLDTTPIQVDERAPPHVKTNVPVPRIQCDRQTLYFLPDHLWVHKDRQYGVVPYGALQVGSRRFTMVETEAIPEDAKIVDYTWEKTNKDGSRDRRYKNNRRLPRCEYAELTLDHPAGFQAHFHFSDAKLTNNAHKALKAFQEDTGSQESVGPADPSPVHASKAPTKRRRKEAFRRLRCRHCGTVNTARPGARPMCTGCGYGGDAIRKR
jgi:hypothetical protein